MERWRIIDFQPFANSGCSSTTACRSFRQHSTVYSSSWAHRKLRATHSWCLHIFFLLSCWNFSRFSVGTKSIHIRSLILWKFTSVSKDVYGGYLYNVCYCVTIWMESSIFYIKINSRYFINIQLLRICVFRVFELKIIILFLKVLPTSG